MSEVYEVLKPIGGGSFGQVYLVRHKREEKQYVIKKIKTRDMSQKDRENTENEVRLLQKLRHTNIVAYKDSYLDREQYLNIVMVYCEGGDIYQKIKQVKGKNFPEEQILDWMAQMALALYYLHDKKILHRDLKTQNIFLKHGRVRLGDFGIAKMLDSTRDFANTCIGTPYYMSPELFKYKPYSYKSDIWAFGCCIYEMCNLRHAFDAQSLNGLAVKIMKGSFAPISNRYSKQLRDLIGKMILTNPKDRPTIWDIINKPILKRRIIPYMQELFSGNYPEANLPQDVDDVYLDSLRDQGQKLGIFVEVQKNIGMPGQKNELILKSQKEQEKERIIQERLKNKKKELWKELKEKRKIEEEIKKLERKKQIQQIKNNQQKIPPQDSRTNIKKHSVAQPDRVSQNRRQVDRSSERIQNKRSYSYERKRDSSLQSKDISDNNQNQAPMGLVEKKKQEIRKSYGQAPMSSKYTRKTPTNQSSTAFSSKLDSKEDLSSQNELDDINQKKKSQKKYDDNKRNQVLQQKEMKKKEQEQRWNQEYNQISQDYIKNRQQAAEKKAAQYRQSSGMLNILGEEQGPGYQQSSQKQLPSYNENNQQQQQQQNEEIEENIYNNNQPQGTNKMHSYEDPQQNFMVYDNNVEQQNSNNNNNQSNVSQPGQKQKKALQIEEEYGMEDEFYEEDDEEKEEVIQEVDNEDSDQEEENKQQIENKIESMKTKLMHTTMKINKLEQTVNQMQTQKQNGYEQEQISEDSELENQEEEVEEENISFNEEEDENSEEEAEEEQGKIPEEGKLNMNPQYHKINDRIKLLRHRCEAGLGKRIFEQAYEYLSNSAEQRVDEVRAQMIQILGDDMIGFWHLTDQILVFENILKGTPEHLEN